MRAVAPTVRALTPNYKPPSVFIGRGPTSLAGCALAWQREWLCITSASGSTISSVVRGWPLPTCWDSDLNSHQAFKGIELLAGNVGVAKVGIAEIGVMQAGRGLRGADLSPPKFDDRNFCVAKVGAVEVGTSQIGTFQRCQTYPCLAPTRSETARRATSRSRYSRMPDFCSVRRFGTNPR